MKTFEFCCFDYPAFSRAFLSQSIIRKTGQYTQHKTKSALRIGETDWCKSIRYVWLFLNRAVEKWERPIDNSRKRKGKLCNFLCGGLSQVLLGLVITIQSFFIAIEIDILNFYFSMLVIENNCHITMYLIIILNSLILIFITRSFPTCLKKEKFYFLLDYHSLGPEDALEKWMATDPSIFA